jgi:hypothetical protein
VPDENGAVGEGGRVGGTDREGVLEMERDGEGVRKKGGGKGGYKTGEMRGCTGHETLGCVEAEAALGRPALVLTPACTHATSR